MGQFITLCLNWEQKQFCIFFATYLILIKLYCYTFNCKKWIMYNVICALYFGTDKCTLLLHSLAHPSSITDKLIQSYHASFWYSMNYSIGKQSSFIFLSHISQFFVLDVLQSIDPQLNLIKRFIWNSFYFLFQTNHTFLGKGFRRLSFHP